MIKKILCDRTSQEVLNSQTSRVTICLKTVYQKVIVKYSSNYSDIVP